MLQTANPQISSSKLLENWWLSYSIIIYNLPSEHTKEWLSLIKEVVKYYKAFCRNTTIKTKKKYQKLCQHTLSKARWELMLLSIYNYVPKSYIKKLGEIQTALETSIQ